MYYTIYKTTNLLNGKYYIGKHQTKDLEDGYMGSGNLLKRAIKKYGKENFKTEILEVYDQEWKMNLAERILVVPDPTNYNLCPGGQGGFGWINSWIKDHPDYTKWRKLGYKLSPNMNREGQKMGPLSIKTRNKISKILKGYPGKWLGKSHTDETKQKMSKSHQGKHDGIKNSQFGTIWITNGVENKKIPKNDLDKWLEKGYTRGRKL